jgi:PAS domain S-box-containing protein
MYNFPGDIAGQIRSDQESPISEYVANKRKAVAFNDAQNDPRVDINTMKLHGITSLLVAPIILYNEVMGIIAFYHHKKSVVFSESQIDFANRVASSLSQAIENADLINEIKKSEKKYHSLYSSMNEGVALHKIVYNQYGEAQDYIITDVNQAYEDLTGNKRNDVVGKKASNVYGTKIPLYIDIYSKVAEKGESNQFETYFKPFNKYFSISVTSPEKGKFFTIFEDITRRKLAEKQKQNLLENEQQLTEELKVSNEELLDKENKLIHINLELQKSEKKYRRILDNLQDAYIKADNDGNIIIASLSAAIMYRFNSPGEMIGTSAKSFYKYHEDRTHVLEQLMENGKIENNEAIALRKDGTTFLASQNAQFYYDDHGQIKGTETLVRDITERRVVEEKVREHAKIFDVINDAIIIIDKSHRIISWNVRAEKLYGWKEEEVLGKVYKQRTRGIIKHSR